MSGLIRPLYLEQPHLAVAADSGFDLALRLGIRPDWVVGDMDSIRDWRALEDFPPERIRRFPREKDATDTELGLSLLAELGVRNVCLAGGGSGRIDHLLGILGLFERINGPRLWFTAREQIQEVEGKLEFAGWRSELVSFFPLGEGASELSSEGLQWPLDGLAWKRGEAGISNRVTSDRGWVKVGKGRLIMVRSLEGRGDD